MIKRKKLDEKATTDEQIIHNSIEYHRRYSKNNLAHKTISIPLEGFSFEMTKNYPIQEKKLFASLSVSINIITGSLGLGHPLRYGALLISPTIREEQTHEHHKNILKKRRNLVKQYTKNMVRIGTTIENGVSIVEIFKEKEPYYLFSFKSNNGALKYIDA